MLSFYVYSLEIMCSQNIERLTGSLLLEILFVLLYVTWHRRESLINNDTYTVEQPRLQEGRHLNGRGAPGAPRRFQGSVGSFPSLPHCVQVSCWSACFPDVGLRPQQVQRSLGISEVIDDRWDHRSPACHRCQSTHSSVFQRMQNKIALLFM